MPFSHVPKPTQAPRTTPGFAAVFIDFENIFYHLKDNFADLPDLNDYVFDILRNLQRHLERRLGLRPIITKAYADFERIKSAPQGSLYLMGIETHNVLGTDHKNSADMKLSIDALEILYTRPEISTFIFVAGDRDYIPLIQHLKKQARSVLVVAFSGNISGDLLINVGSENFIDAFTLLDPYMKRRLEDMARRQRHTEEIERARDAQRTLELEAREALMAQRDELGYSQHNGDHNGELNGVNGAETTTEIEPIDVLLQHEEPQFNPPTEIIGQNEKVCLEVLLMNYGHHHEVWMSPFLRKLSDALPSLADFERKALVTTLESSGAIKVEKRRGEPYDYSIVLINYNHPAIRELSVE